MDVTRTDASVGGGGVAAGYLSDAHVDIMRVEYNSESKYLFNRYRDCDPDFDTFEVCCEGAFVTIRGGGG